ncbi:hypothetical protein GE061_004021 [Apolygus lucorum]|uniref:SWI/SNF-related matrix-associated actin-dependent regulator of chromatin subfamily A containing DEAD/H box 1 homolog n=1 Tax=Apolygus lucorum TaxID=248454 RepID=A0A6A4IWU9_APOLU|nr:hypothetical protein GE061_004021 [Apolygus lucorum]
MLSSTSTKEKSKLTDHFKKFAFEKDSSDGKSQDALKKPDHEVSDEDDKSGVSSNKSTPSKHSNSSKSSTPSKHSSSSDGHRSSSHRSSGSHSSSSHKSSSSSPHKSSSSSHKSSSNSHKSSSHSKHDKNGVKPNHSISESDGDSRNSTPVKKSRIANRAQLEDSSDDDEPKRTFSRIKTFSSESKSRKRIRVPDSGSGSDGDSKSSHSTVTSDRGKRRALNRDRRSPVIERKKKKKVVGSDDERWSDTVLVDSDEEEYVSKKATNTMTTTKTRVFEFMNDATKDELLLVNSVTSKKADMIIQSRPFQGWLDLLVKLKCEKYLGADVLDNALEVLKSKHIVSRLMNKCLDLAVSTEKAILEGGSTLTTQPAILTPTMQLKSYQMVGLNWLVVMHKQKLNGILADEMGLGKTIQVVAFISYLREAGITNGPHLIVCPTSTIDNWAIEFTKWCPEIRVEIYHGSQDERKFLRTRWFKEKFKTMDVIVTSYQIVGSNAEERKMFKIMPLQYVVFDEAHMLKNMNTARYGHLFSINATFRILLTGTPLQNNLLELMSLLNFVMPNMFSSKIEYIKSFFSKRPKPGGSGENITNFEQEQVDLAKRIMKPFVMRRLKQDVLKDLPKKTNVVLKVPMDEEQKIKYNDLLEEIREIAKKQDPDNPANFMSSFMQLRKLSNHPLTLRFHYQDTTLKEMASRLAADYGFKETNEDHIFEDLCFSSDHDIHKLTQEHKCVGKFKLDDSLFKESGKFRKLDELLPKLKQEGHRVVMFSQFVFMLDIIEEYLRINNHEFCRLDGSTSMGDRQELIDDFNDDSEIFVFLLTTRAGGVGINLTSADTVIIHDVDFNPYNDKQAEDRCHRLGQTRPVQVIRLISEDTVEEKIYAMAQSKLNLEQELIGKDEEESETTKKVESLLKEVLGFVKKK